MLAEDVEEWTRLSPSERSSALDIMRCVIWGKSGRVELGPNCFRRTS